LKDFPMLPRLAFLFAISVCVSSGPASAQGSGSEAHIPIEAIPLTLDPHRMRESHEFRIAQDLFEGLTTESATGAVIPGVASSWTASRDGRTWTFHLRPDARWSDGSPVTADDFVYSLRRAIAPGRPSPAADVLRPIAGADALRSGQDGDACDLEVRARNALTLVITLARPTPWLPLLLAHFAAMPVQRRAVEAYGEDWIRPEHFVGNGAYRLVRWTAEGEIILQRNPYFHDASHVRVATIHMSPAPEQGRALAALRNGSFDVVTVTGAEFAAAQSQMPRQIVTQTELATAYIVPNIVAGPTRWPALRLALSMVLDRESLIHDVEQANHAPAYEAIAPGLAGYAPARLSWADEPLPDRRARARRVIDHQVAPLQLTILDSPKSRRLGQALVAAWSRALPLSVELRPLPERAFLAALSSHDFQLALVSWDPDFADPSNTLSMFRSDAGAANFGNYADTHFDSLLERADRMPDSRARARTLREAEQQLLDYNAVIPLKHGVVEFVVSPRLRGWLANPLARHPSRFLELVESGPTPP
jgi:oligopeptide transport system substrate-binding protein